jgi:hypothetical protein
VHPRTAGKEDQTIAIAASDAPAFGRCGGASTTFTAEQEIVSSTTRHSASASPTIMRACSFQIADFGN